MKIKISALWLSCSIVLFVLVLSVVLFVSVREYNTNFWFSYGFILLSWGFLLSVTMHTSFASKTGTRNRFLRMPRLLFSAIYVLLQLTAGILIMAFPAFNSTAAFVLQLLLACVYGIIVFFTSAFRDKSIYKENSTSSSTEFVRKLCVDAGNLLECCSAPETHSILSQFIENVRYSDPVSTEKAYDYEVRIMELLDALKEKIHIQPISNTQKIVEEMNHLLTQRNTVCAISKQQ